MKKRVDPQTVLQRNPHGSHITDSKAERDMQGAGRRWLPRGTAESQQL
ncbi:hypothetical protein [Blautia wexlerae]|nr:hypothetical protein [Blautia wexlerae]